jgi:hypothetical protein
MPGGKPAGVPCANLDPVTYRCRIWETADYPAVCRAFRAEPEVCGSTRAEALHIIARLEDLTA